MWQHARVAGVAHDLRRLRSIGDIGLLFIAGFGSSLVFGTFAGAACDRAGRRRGCLGYVGSYALSCMLKHSPNYWVLMVGRLLGGISTSLLFSAFEAWMVRPKPPTLAHPRTLRN